MQTNKEIVRYRAKPAVKVIERHHQLQNLLSPLNEYEWFSNKNRVNALQSYEASASALKNRFFSQAALYRKDVITFYNKDKAEGSVAIGRRLGMKAKIFAVHEHQNGFAQFEIKSTKWDWQVLPLEMSNERVPAAFLERRNLFASYGVKFESYAIAVPSKPNYMPASHVLKTETISTMKSLAKAGKKLGEMSYKTLKSAAPAVLVGTSAAMAAKMAIASLALTDPVLLGTYGKAPMFLVEIGRWE